MSRRLAIYCDCDSDSGMLTYTLMLLNSLREYSDVETLVISSEPRTQLETARINKLSALATTLLCVPRQTSSAAIQAKSVAQIIVDNRVNYYIPNYRYMPHMVLSYLPRHVRNIIIVHNDTEEIYSAVKFYAPAIDGIIFPSKSAYRKNSHVLLRPNKTCIPHYFSALGEAGAESKSGILEIVYHGRLANSQKRSMELLNIARELNHRSVPFKMKLIGSGDALDTIRQQIINSSIKNVEVIGQVSREELIGHLHNAHVSLSTSIYEGFCYSVAESLSLGIVPVVYENDVLHDLIQNNVNGYLVPWGRADLVAEKIELLHHDRQRLQSMRNAAIESVKTLISPERYANQMVAFFDELTAMPIGDSWPLLRPRGLAYDTLPSRLVAKLGKKLRLW